MTPLQALNQLKANPRAFLWDQPINIAGGGLGGVRNATFTEGNRKWRLNVDDTAPLQPNDVSLQVWNFPMILKSQTVVWGAVPATHVTSANPPIVVTGMLTGCTIAIARISDTELHLTHVQPGGVRPTGLETENLMRDHAVLNGHAPTQFYGPSKYLNGVNCAHVIGVAVNGVWQVWGQGLTGMYNEKVAFLHRIV